METSCQRFLKNKEFIKGQKIANIHSTLFTIYLKGLCTASLWIYNY
jgi:hypothetical protein